MESVFRYDLMHNSHVGRLHRLSHLCLTVWDNTLVELTVDGGVVIWRAAIARLKAAQENGKVTGLALLSSWLPCQAVGEWPANMIGLLDRNGRVSGIRN